MENNSNPFQTLLCSFDLHFKKQDFASSYGFLQEAHRLHPCNIEMLKRGFKLSKHYKEKEILAMVDSVLAKSRKKRFFKICLCEVCKVYKVQNPITRKIIQKIKELGFYEEILDAVQQLMDDEGFIFSAEELLFLYKKLVPLKEFNQARFYFLERKIRNFRRIKKNNTFRPVKILLEENKHKSSSVPSDKLNIELSLKEKQKSVLETIKTSGQGRATLRELKNALLYAVTLKTSENVTILYQALQSKDSEVASEFNSIVEKFFVIHNGGKFRNDPRTERGLVSSLYGTAVLEFPVTRRK